MNLLPQRQFLHLVLTRGVYDLIPLVDDRWFFSPPLHRLFVETLETMRDGKGLGVEQVKAHILASEAKEQEKANLVTQLVNLATSDLKYHESFLIDGLRGAYREYVEEGLVHTLSDKAHSTADSRIDAIGAAYKALSAGGTDQTVGTLNDAVRQYWDNVAAGVQTKVSQRSMELSDSAVKFAFHNRIWPEPYILAGREKFRKTQTLLNLLLDLTSSGHPGILYTFEDSIETILYKCMAIRYSLDMSQVALGSVEAEKAKEVKERSYGQWGKRLKIDPSSYTPERWERAVRASCMSERVDWIAVDFVQSFRYRRLDEVHELSKIGKIIRELCKEFVMPCFTLSQVNKRDEDEDSGEVKLHIGNLKGSGALAEDARMVYLLDGQASSTTLNWKCVKSKYSGLSTMELDFDGPSGRLLDGRYK